MVRMILNTPTDTLTLFQNPSYEVPEPPKITDLLIARLKHCERVDWDVHTHLDLESKQQEAGNKRFRKKEEEEI